MGCLAWRNTHHKCTVDQRITWKKDAEGKNTSLGWTALKERVPPSCWPLFEGGDGASAGRKPAGIFMTPSKDLLGA